MEEIKRCFKCGGKLNPCNTNELQKRFSNGVQEYLCDVCADIANHAIYKSREFYGIENKAYNIVMRKFKRKNNIPMFGRVNAKQAEMIEKKREALIRLMFWMDIRSVKKALANL